MVNAKYLLVAALAALGTHGLAQNKVIRMSTSKEASESALNVLLKALDKSRKISIDAIVLKRSSRDDCNTFRMKVEQNNAGCQRTTVLSPIWAQGITSYDDGKNWKTFWPDESKMLVQTSPRPSQQEMAERFALAGQNYRFEFLNNQRIAGREVFVVSAAPNATGMPSREYAVDKETSFVMRIETISGKKKDVLLDTVAIRFDSLKNANLDISPLKPTTIMNRQAPKSFGDPNSIKNVVGFVPSVPKQLPFGFTIQEKHLAGVNEFKFPVISITDGLASAIIYQFPSHLDDLVDSAVTREAKGIKFQAVGDLPSTILNRLLEAFLREISKGLMARMGTDDEDTALTRLNEERCFIVITIK